MPAGTPLNVDLLVLSVAATLIGTYDPITDIDTASTSKTRAVNRRPRFMGTARSATATPEEAISIAGMLSKGDTGQERLRAAADTNTTVFIQVLPDGTNGFKQEANVSGKTWDADAGGDLQNYAFEIAPFGTRTAVGTGLTDL